MTSQEMMRTTLPKNHIFYDVSELGEETNFIIIHKPNGWDEDGNPNSPVYENKLFGYDEKEFLAKQYKLKWNR